jgi:hypothetical protein
MPKWMRLKSTGDYPFHQRVLSSYENGFDEGPVAQFTAFVLAFIVIGAVTILLSPLVIYFIIKNGVDKLRGLRNTDEQMDGSNP